MDINILNNSWVIYLFLNFPRQAYVSACVQKQKRNERKSAERVDINLFLLRNRPITFNNYTSIRLISFYRDYIKDSPRLQKKKRQMRFSLAHFASLEYTFQSLIHTFSPSPPTFNSSECSHRFRMLSPLTQIYTSHQCDLLSKYLSSTLTFLHIPLWSFKFLLVSDLFWYDSLRLLWFYY